jgi:hypothetical protein
LGQHLATCTDCVNAVQVLTVQGTPAERFAWRDPADDRSPREVLEEHGIQFQPNGTADAAQRLSPTELKHLAKATG